MALTLHLVSQHAHSYLPENVASYLEPYFFRARKVLDGLSDNELSTWKNKVHVVHDWLTFQPPEHDEAITSSIYKAVMSEKQILAKYQPRGKEPKDYVLNPISLVFRGQITYLLCTVGDHENVLIFQLSRFSNVDVSENSITEASRKVDIKAFLDQGAFGQFNTDKKIKFVARINKTKGTHLRETPLSVDQVIIHDRDDSFLLTATMADSSHLLWWVLSLGDKIEVIEPLSLREKVIEQIASMVYVYGLHKKKN